MLAPNASIRKLSIAGGSLLKTLLKPGNVLNAAVLLLPTVLCHSAIADDTLSIPAEVVAPAPFSSVGNSMPSVSSPVEYAAPAPLQALPTAAESEFTPVYRQPNVYQPVMTRQVAQPTPVAGTAVQGEVVTGAPQGGYVRLGAPLYPSPSPHTPIWTGGSMITNQAFAPHEMLYAHKYKALYPPYYHKVKGHWLLTPFGVKSHERWELQGTMVEVNYHSHYPLIPHFVRPHTPQNKGPWR